MTLSRADIERIRDEWAHADQSVWRDVRDLATTALGLMGVGVGPCDIQDDNNVECAGPRFTDPGSYGDPDMTICAFHALLNRNYWVNKANTAEASIRALEEGLREVTSAYSTQVADHPDDKVAQLILKRAKALLSERDDLGKGGVPEHMPHIDKKRNDWCCDEHGRYRAPVVTERDMEKGGG